MQLWEEAKKSFLEYKEEARRVAAEKEDLQKRCDLATTAQGELQAAVREQEQKIQSLTHKNEQMAARLRVHEGDRNSAAERLRDLEEKNNELESSFFDLKMENIKLKDELDRYRKNAG
jgi:chromosome segregation ATPase